MEEDSGEGRGTNWMEDLGRRALCSSPQSWLAAECRALICHNMKWKVDCEVSNQNNPKKQIRYASNALKRKITYNVPPLFELRQLFISQGSHCLFSTKKKGAFRKIAFYIFPFYHTTLGREGIMHAEY